MHWITITEASRLTGKSELTIRRLVKKRESDASFVRRDNGKIYIEINKLATIYRLVNDESKDYSDSEGNKTSQMQIVSSSETIKELSKHIEQKDKQIEFLINRKSKLPLWLTIGFLVLIITILAGLYVAFVSYKGELVRNQSNELLRQSKVFEKELQLIEYTNSKVLSGKESEINVIKSNNSKLLSAKAEIIDNLNNQIREKNEIIDNQKQIIDKMRLSETASE